MSSEDFEMAPMTFSGHQSYDEQVAEKFGQLTSLNLNDKAESKNGLTYVSWANAWKAFKEVYPTATYRIIKDPKTNMPYFVDSLLGIMVFTEVSANGLTYEMWLPVMDSSNKAMKTEPYTYQVWDRYAGKYTERRVEAATMFDINKTLMRCLVKNLSMFGLALYIYAGEDLPEQVETPANEPKKPRKAKTAASPSDRFTIIREAINAADSTMALVTLYKDHQAEVESNPDIKALFTARKQELLNAA